MKKIMLGLTLSSLTFSAFAVEDKPIAPNKNYYLQFNVGAAHGLKPKMDFPTGKNMSDTGLVGVEAGYKFNENYRVGASFDYLPSFSNTCDTSRVREGFPTTGTSYIKVKSYVAMLNLYYDMANSTKFTPYITVGAGVAKNISGKRLEKNQIPSLNISSMTYDDSLVTTNFAYKLGIGSKYTINNSFDLDLRYQFVDLGIFRTGVAKVFILDGGYTRNYQARSAVGMLRAHEVLIGIAYKF